MVKNTERKKVRKSVKRVEKTYVNRSCMLTGPVDCGKLLWKRLWRMWKTVSFQQEFGLLDLGAGLWKSVYTGLHKTDYKVVTETLRYRNATGLYLRKRAEKLDSYQK